MLIYWSMLTITCRRKQAKLYHLFKIIATWLDRLPVCTYYICKRPLAIQHKTGLNLSLQDISVNSSQFLYSFYPHSISLWNSLPPNHQMLTTLYSFERSLSQQLTLINYTVILLSVVYLFTSWIIMLCISSCYSYQHQKLLHPQQQFTFLWL